MSARKLRWRKDGARNIPVDEACWQYILDHARPDKDGTLWTRIPVKSQESFFKSLQARIEGKYRFMLEDLLPSNQKEQ